MSFHKISRLLVLLLVVSTFEVVFMSPANASSYTFTNAGATGANGPTQAQVNSAYTGSNLDGLVTIGTQGYQIWTVPATGSYSVTVAGAVGGSGNNGTQLGGNGVVATSTINLVQGDSLTIVVGQSGLPSILSGGGGGGGSFVVSSGSVNGLLMAAGGGGGAGKNGPGVNATTTTSAAAATNGSFGGTTNAAGATNNAFSAYFGGSGGGAVGTFASNLLSKVRDSNISTITTSTSHGFTTSRQVFLLDVGDGFDGNWRVASVPTATTFTFQQYITNFPVQSASGRTLVGSNGVAGSGSGGLGGGGGAGYGGVGGKSNNATEVAVARSFLAGAKGGVQTNSNYGDENTNAGGFGGGGTGTKIAGNNGGGGGGGYTGGGGGNGASPTNSGLGGGGGGTYITGTNQTSLATNSGMGYVTIAMPDNSVPSFTSSSDFSVTENILTSATAATIRVSESATVSISSGVDAARFNITRSETNTAIIKFNSSPNYESPADVGGNNIYELTLTATDSSGNAGTQSITITVTDVLDTSSFNSFALAGSVTTVTFRTSVTITANISVSSRVTFRGNGKALPGCISKATTGSGSSHSVTCSWRPSVRGIVTLSATSTPTAAGISGASSSPVSAAVERRVCTR